MTRVLVLGAAGFIGAHLLHAVAESGDHSITAVDNLSRGKADESFTSLLDQHANIAFVKADLTDRRSFDRLNEWYDQVYLLAGVVGVRNVERDPARVLCTNTTIILNTLEWLRRKGCGRLMFSSTSEVYAGSVELGMAGVPTPEGVPAAFIDVQHTRYAYAISKLHGEAAVTHYARSAGFEAVILRYHNIYGPRMGFDHVVPELMERSFRRVDPFPVYGWEQTRSFCYVSDAVDASLAVMNVPISDREIVHVGNGREEIKIGDLTNKILDLVDFHPTVKTLPAPSGGVSRRCPDVEKLYALTGFRAQVSLDEGLARTWDWYRQHLAQRGALSTASQTAYPSKEHDTG